MDNNLINIYNNILVPPMQGEEKYTIFCKIKENLEKSVSFSYTGNYREDCKMLFKTVISEKTKDESYISEKTLKEVLDSYLFFKLLKDNKIYFPCLNFDKDEKKEINKTTNNIQESFKKFIEEKFPIKEFRIFNRIYNIDVDSKEELGQYTLYNVKSNQNNSELKKYIDSLSISTNCSEVVLETKVMARDEISACNISDRKERNFLNILSFLSFSKVVTGQNYLLSEKYKMFFSSENVGEMTDLEFNSNLKINEIKNKETFKDLLNLIQKDSPLFLEEKIITALWWYRDSLLEKDSKNALVKAIIALESLILTKKLSDDYGIVDSIKKIVHYLLGNSISNSYLKNLDELYTKRSKIVHEGKIYTSSQDKEIVLIIVKKIIKIFLSKVKENKFKTKKEYNDYFGNIIKNN